MAGPAAARDGRLLLHRSGQALLLVAGGAWPCSYSLLTTIHCSRRTTHCAPRTTHYPPYTIHYSLPTTHYALRTHQAYRVFHRLRRPPLLHDRVAYATGMQALP